MRPNTVRLAVDDEADEWRPSQGARGGMIDLCSREGAALLKAKIEDYWRERGLSVIVTAHNVGFHSAIRAARYDLRSDMVNGWPRRGAAPAQRQTVFVEEFDDDDLVFE